MAVDAPSGVTVNPDFDGVSDTRIADAGIGAAPSSTQPATQVYSVTVQFMVPAGIAQDAACDPAQEPGGLLNDVELSVGLRVSGAVACADLPDVPVPGLTKSVLSQTQQADGTWVMEYEITVANPSGTAASLYTLEDDLALGDGMTVVGDPTVVGPAGVAVDADFDGDAEQVISEDILLPAAGSHTYTVTAVVDAGSVTGNDPAGDCVFDAGETGTGFANFASLDTGVATAGDNACARAWDPGVTKELNGVPVQQVDGSWLLSYTMTVTNPSAVALTYGLVDELDFPTGTVVTVESAAGRAGSPAVLATWDGETQTQLVATGTPLPPNAVHIFDVTVRAMLPGTQTSTPGGWANTATVESGVGGVVTTDAVETADILVPELEVAKAVTADPVLRIGDVVSYVVTIENTGDGDFTALFPAVAWDDLADVLDDADLVGRPIVAPARGTVTTAGDRYSWSGALTSGSIVTLTYQVTITGGGNADLVNVAFRAAPTAANPVTPDPATCAGPACAVTDTAMPALQVTKDASATSVAPGAGVNYVVTVTNTGGADIPAGDPATITDDLSGVLDDAALTSGPTANTGNVTIAGTTLTWTGGLNAGQTATIRYSVRVNDSTKDGAELKNVAISDPTLAMMRLGGGATPATASTSTLVTQLAMTGLAINLGAIALAVLLLLGGWFLRRRRPLEAD